MRRFRPHLSYANVVSTICLFVVLGGVAYAGLTLPKNSVGTKQLKRNAVKGSKVANRSLTSADIRGPVDSARSAANAGTADQAVSAQLLAGSRPSSFLASDRVARARSAATIAAGGRFDPLLSMGPLTLETNCENSGLAVYLRVMATTSAAEGRVTVRFSPFSGGSGLNVMTLPPGVETGILERDTSSQESGAGDIVYSDPSTTILIGFSYLVSDQADSCRVDGVAIRG